MFPFVLLGQWKIYLRRSQEKNQFQFADSTQKIYGILALPDEEEFKALIEGVGRQNYFLQLKSPYLTNRTYLSPPGKDEGFIYETPKEEFNIVARFSSITFEGDKPLTIEVVKSYSEYCYSSCIKKIQFD